MTFRTSSIPEWSLLHLTRGHERDIHDVYLFDITIRYPGEVIGMEFKLRTPETTGKPE